MVFGRVGEKIGRFTRETTVRVVPERWILNHPTLVLTKAHLVLGGPTHRALRQAERSMGDNAKFHQALDRASFYTNQGEWFTEVATATLPIKALEQSVRKLTASEHRSRARAHEGWRNTDFADRKFLNAAGHTVAAVAHHAVQLYYSLPRFEDKAITYYRQQRKDTFAAEAA